MTIASTIAANEQKYITLSVVCPEGERTDHRLDEGVSLIVGQGDNCGLKLEGDDDISPIHCVVQFNEGKVTIQDWCSKTGTLVDGQNITDEVTVDPGVQIGVGGYTMSTTIGKAKAALTNPTAASSQQPSPDASKQQVESNSLAASDSESDGSHSNEVALLDSLIEDQPSERMLDQPPVPQQPPAPRRRQLTPEQSFNQETIELLQEELELIQSEVAERDNQIAELTALVDGSPVEPVVDNSESETLVTRLNDLLDELEHSDQRVRALEELLRVEQETSRAEQEERVQMTRWLHDIEQRISEREAEARAERDVLTHRVKELKQQLEDADRQICQAASEASPQAAHDGTLKKLREENERLSEEIGNAQEQQRRLEHRIESMADKSPEENQQEIIEEAIREERMKMAQERATLSRERADLARQFAEVQSAAKPAAAADEKFNAFRQTLKQLHAEENRDGVTRKPTLGTRIADLWKRLDGPSDTD